MIKFIVSKLAFTLFLFSFLSFNVSAAFPTDFWPQFGQTAEWTVTNDNELSFVGNPGNSAMVATSFGNLGVPPFAGVRLSYDAYISTDGAKNFIVILGSNAAFPGTGIMIVGNIYQIQALKNFDYGNAVMLSSNVGYYQNTAVIPGAYNSFIIDVSATGLITVTINGYQCPTTYQADINVLNAAGTYAAFCPGFSPFKLKNLTVIKGASTKRYFHPVPAFTGSYYIDAVNGDDSASGHTDTDAWKTFANVNNRVLAAGTKVLLKSGSVWNQRLEIRGAGTVNNWITVGAYGTGNKPKISLTNNANDIGLLICDLDKTSGVAKMQNISYIEVKDIEIANTRLGIYYRTIIGTTNTGFRVSNVTFNNINCDPVMTAINSASNKDTEITNQLAAVKGNLQTIAGAADGGVNEYVFPAAIFIGGQTMGNQTVSGTHTTVLTELEVYNCQFNEAIAGVMSVFYWPFVSGGGSNIWRQLVNKVKLANCSATGVVNGAIAFDGVNGGAVADVNGVMQPDANGWGLIKNVRVTMGASAPGRTWPHGTTGVIFSNSQKMLVDSCEFSEVLNQGNPDGCGFDFETNNDLVTIQNTKFINNDGHSVLIMNGGSFGGNTNLIFQNNLFAGNIKSGTSPTEFSLSPNSDGHSNVKVRNNIVFMRKKNINNENITFYNTSRTYFSSTYNDFYYLEPTAGAITVSFLGLPYTYNAQVSSVTAPQVAGLLLNNGAATTNSRTIKVSNQCSLTKGKPAYYMMSENASFSGANWMLYQSNFDYTLSANNGNKTLYFKVKNVSGESPVFSATITLNTIYIVVSSNNSELGNTTGGNYYEYGTLVNLNATPTAGNHFVSWTEAGNIVTSNASYTFSATVNRTLIANFEPDVLNLSSGSTNASTISCSTCNVIVPSGGELVIDADKTLQSIDVAAGGKLTIIPGKILTVSDPAPNGIILRTSDAATATLVDTQNNSYLILNGTIKQALTLGRNWYISSPITSGVASVLNRGTSVQSYSEASKTWTLLAGTDPLVVGKGYVSIAAAGQGANGNVIFSGTFNTGRITVPVTRTESGSSRGFNLVANPYPSYLDWSKVIAPAAGNSGIGSSLWYRTKNNSEAYIFVTHNGVSGYTIPSNQTPKTIITKFIPPMQSFWVRVNENAERTTHNATIAFTNDMRSHSDNAGNLFKAPSNDERQRLRLQLTNGTSSDEALVYFDSNAANNFDDYDSPKMMNNSTTLPDLYSKAGEERLVINGMTQVTDNMTIPLGFTLKSEANNLTIRVNELTKFSQDTKIYLVDSEKNTQTELFPETEYVFNIANATINNENRFSLMFRSQTAPSATSIVEDLNVHVFLNAANQIVIDSPEKCKYAIYNALGQLLINGFITSQPFIANCELRTGIYVVKLIANTNDLTTKLIVK